MRRSIAWSPVLLSLALLASGAQSAFGQGFVCDLENWDGTADSGFGAGANEIRGFATTPQSVPLECMSGGYSYVNGVIVYATRQGGSPTMPIHRVDILQSSMSGPPGAVITSGPGGTIDNVPTFPGTTRKPFPAAPAVALFDFDADGDLDLYASPAVYAEGNATPGQFLPYSRSGSAVPCHTGLDGQPLDEPCTNGDPLLRAMGIGMRVAAGMATIDKVGIPCAFEVRTNNPDAAVDSFFDITYDVTIEPCTPPGAMDFIRIFGGNGGLIQEFTNVAPGDVRSFLMTPGQVAEFLGGEIEVELQEGGKTDREKILPADTLIFEDGFESGDLSAWSSSIP